MGAAAILTTLGTLLRSASTLLWPRTCHLCGAPLLGDEEVLCSLCLARMPRLRGAMDTASALSERLASPTVRVERVAALFRYVRGDAYASLITAAKYDGRPRIAATLARMLAAELLPQGFFAGITLIVPVPMARLKRLDRGYNQAEVVARAVGDVAAIPVGRCLRALPHATQTRRGLTARWLNVQDAFAATRPAELRRHSHILLTDDVLTTGATLMACARAIHAEAPSTRLSVLTLAATSLN